MYQVIARKYRPQTFADLIGQEHVRSTLENAIAQRRIAHGYIFSGQRGTGKTSIARILARCLNCVEGPTVTPCGVCSSCLEITQGNAPDVIEIDAASNRGINEMRELRENVRYRPARDRYKIFIIDEAHQITNEAFNALLKTLEEPPEWVVFVLCTTESHKIPTTIASRCQQFSFRSVDFAPLVERMRWICAQENVATDEEALAVLAQAGEGSVRDSLSALDQAIACCGNSLTGPAVRDLLGMYSLESLAAVTRALAASDAPGMLEVVAALEANGKNLQHFTRELARWFRNLLVARLAPGQTRLIAASAADQTKMRETAAQFAEEDLTRWLQLTLDLYGQLQYSLQPRFHLELGLLRLIHAGRLKTVEEALQELGPAEAPSPPRPAPRPFEPAQPGSAAGPPPAAPPPVSGSAPLKERLRAALESLGASAFTLDAVDHAELAQSPAGIEFIAPRHHLLALRNKQVEEALAQILGRAPRIRLTSGNGANGAPDDPPPPPKPADDEETMRRALEHPGVRRFQEVFPGARVMGVRNLKE